VVRAVAGASVVVPVLAVAAQTPAGGRSVCLDTADRAVDAAIRVSFRHRWRLPRSFQFRFGPESRRQCGVGFRIDPPIGVDLIEIAPVTRRGGRAVFGRRRRIDADPRAFPPLLRFTGRGRLVARPILEQRRAIERLTAVDAAARS